MPSFYQGEFFRDLVKLEEIDLLIVYSKSLPASRKQLGWQDDQTGYSSVILSDSLHPIQKAMRLAWNQSDRFHIVNGMWAESTFATALLVLKLAHTDFAIYSESSNPLKSRHRLKMVSRNIYSKLLLGSAKGVLPVGSFGAQFFHNMGLPEEKIYPFGYFRQARTHLDFQDSENNDILRLVFVGQLIERKGVDILLDEVATMIGEGYTNIQLTLIGDGEQRGKYEQRVAHYDMQDRIIFTGAISSDDVLTHIQHSDALVLPSRWDGWGLVVNEALSVGVPVIVSDTCGAADLIVDGFNGYVFSILEENSLRQKLEEMIKKHDSWATMRANAASVGQAISTEVMAKYLLACIKHMKGQITQKPQLPWVSLIEHQSS